MRIATWNVNSLRARLERVQAWMQNQQPDVLCIQETKMKDEIFPTDVFADMGYQSIHHGQGQWNGVAILSRVGLDNPVCGFLDSEEPDPQTRLVWATCGGIRIGCAYVPNGRALDNDHYVYKLNWLERLYQNLDNVHTPDQSILVCGDFNIAPEDRDVWDPEHFVGMTHVSEKERNALQKLEVWGLTDVFRKHNQEDQMFSWWDYRAGSFHKGNGMRIDLLMCSESVTSRVDDVVIDREERKGKGASDHAPVFIDVHEIP